LIHLFSDIPLALITWPASAPQDIQAEIRSRDDVRAVYTGFDWRKHQLEISEYNGSALLIAPTGSGKTEAALLWAGQQAEAGRYGRLAILLPYQESLNAMQKRLIDRFHPEVSGDTTRWNDRIGLLHGRATRHLYELFLQQEHAPNEAALMARRSNELARLFAAPVAVSTIFSVVRLLFATRGAERLFVSFSNSRIVVDEIHTYDADITSLALAALRFLQQDTSGRECY
jgi:CRISPR-associated endonuclease/helicase Cas3